MEHGGRGIPGEWGMRRQGAETLRFIQFKHELRSSGRDCSTPELNCCGILNTGIRLAGLSIDDFAFLRRSRSPLDVASKYYLSDSGTQRGKHFGVVIFHKQVEPLQSQKDNDDTPYKVCLTA